jgi:hypothetical protein
MINLLASLVDRTLDRAPVLQRRHASLFESPRVAAVSLTPEHAGEPLREDDEQSDTKMPLTQKTPRDMGETTIAEPRPRSRATHPQAAAMLVPEATDVTAVEAKPPFQPPAPPSFNLNRQDDSTIREESLTRAVNEPPSFNQQKDSASTPTPATIVETQVQREIVSRDRADEQPFEEITILDFSPRSPSPAANPIVARPADARRETPQNATEARLRKPPEQPRSTRQQMQRDLYSRLQPQPPLAPVPPPPTINVTIGRIEVRASASTKRTESARPAAPKLSLEDYLRGRSRGN